MKKGIIALLVVLALVVIVSPGILGRFAEKSVDENLNWAAQEGGELVVTSENFDRGWFSSEGQHRVEVREGNLTAMLEMMGGEPGHDDLPVLLINTHLDHGLIPVSSMSREKGSLAPGLGNAISTLSIEFGDGEEVDIPGTIYSTVGLGGELQSNYVLDAGSRADNGATATWDETEIEITSDASGGDVSFAGNIGSFSFSDGQDSFAVDGLTFTGSQAPTKFGFSIGDLKLSLDAMSILSNGVQAGGVKRMSVDGSTTIDNGRLNGHTLLEMESQVMPQFGEFSVIVDVDLEGADAEAVGALQTVLEAQGTNPDPYQLLSVAEDELKQVLAGGLDLRFNRFDVALPMGTVTTKLDISVPEDDAATFEWTSLLQSAEAAADISVPEELVQLMMQMNPEAGAIIGMGFLQKNGDAYEMEARYKKGLLTINGAPMPIPLGMIR